MSYPIKQDYIPFGQSRSGRPIDPVRFIVAHDTGNGGSSAQSNVNWFKGNPVQASAHAFIDDVEIIEDVPLDEKAWHVIYNVKTDNRMYGDDANDCAIGVELCYGGSIDFGEAYKKYVWYLAYLCTKFNLNPKTDIVGHSKLDPGRKSDPENALNRYGKTFNDLIRDVYKETNGKPMDDGMLENGEQGKAIELLQKDLMRAGYKLPKYGADGDYGDETENVVRMFQKRHGLSVDGIAGENTLTKLEEVINMEKTGFKDVSQESKLSDEIKKGKNYGITEGFPDGTFRPDETMTRAEGLVYAVRAYEKALEEAKK